MSEKIFICHVCWRDRDCDCKGACDWKKGEKHECDCEFCFEDWSEPPIDGKCSCICHLPIPSHCNRCGNTRKIKVDLRG